MAVILLWLLRFEYGDRSPRVVCHKYQSGSKYDQVTDKTNLSQTVFQVTSFPSFYSDHLAASSPRVYPEIRQQPSTHICTVPAVHTLLDETG